MSTLSGRLVARILTIAHVTVDPNCCSQYRTLNPKPRRTLNPKPFLKDPLDQPLGHFMGLEAADPQIGSPAMSQTSRA